MTKNKFGLFITFEGPEGSGKTTVIKSLKNSLLKKINEKTIDFSNVITTREPGGTNNNLCEDIRQILLNKDYKIPGITEAFLFATSRSAHLLQTILPALQKNEIVLCDRFVDSSIVYQEKVKQIGKVVTRINKIALQKVKPNLTIYLKLDPQIGLSRIAKNKRVTNRFDNEDFNFHQKISNVYDKHFAHKKNVIIVDANDSKEQILFNCEKAILKYIKKNK